MDSIDEANELELTEEEKVKVFLSAEKAKEALLEAYSSSDQDDNPPVP